MHITLLADRPARDLFPICEHRPPALLPVSGRPVIEHVLAALAARGGGRVDVVLGDDDEQTEAHLRAVQWPQNDVRIFRGRAPDEDGWRLMVRGDVCPHPSELEDALTAYLARRPMAAGVDGVVGVLEPGVPVPSWRQSEQVIAAGKRDSEAWCGLFLSLADYHRLAMRAAKQRLGLAGTTIAGWADNDGTRVGVGTTIATRRRLGPGVVVGSRSVVDRDVTTANGALIGDGCFIGAGTHLENSIVVDGTFVASGLMLKNAIVAGQWIYQISSNVSVRAPSRLLRSRLH